MVEFTVQHTCGHESTHKHNGPETDQRRRLEWLRRRPCQACWRVKQANAAAVQRDESGLPELVGAADEIDWAEVIRAKAITRNRDLYARVTRKPKNPAENTLHQAIVEAANDAMRELESQTEAAWWIEHRFDVIDHLRKATVAAVEPLMDGGKE